ncbi:MAG: sialidase family protein [Planctomycetota bacterium]
MKRLSVVVVSLLFFAGALPAQEDEVRNLLENPSFEQVGQGGGPFSWRKAGASESAVARERGGLFGDHCLSMRMAEGGQYVYVDQSVPRPPGMGERYVFSAYMRSDGPIDVDLVIESYFRALNKESTVRKRFPVTGEWKRCWADRTIDLEGAGRMRVIIQIHKPGVTVYVDGAMLEEKAAGDPADYSDAASSFRSVEDPFFPIDRIAFPEDDFDYSKYPAAITGYTGQDRQRVAFLRWEKAERRRVGLRGNYKAGFTQLPDGRLVLAACRHSEDEKGTPGNKFWTVHVYESTDQGSSWKELNETPLFGKEPALAALPDGVLVLTAQEMNDRPGFKAGEMNAFRSEDQGRTWQRVRIDDEGCPYPYPRNIIVDRDGPLLYLRAHEILNIETCRSMDGGKTWEFRAGDVDWDQKDVSRCFAEIAVLRVSDGRLLAALRREIPGMWGEGFEDTFLAESTDDGRHWSRPWRISNTAEVHMVLTELSDGRLLGTYANYHHPFGVCAIVSDDGGRTWDRDSPVQLALSASCYAGWPVTLALPDGSLITSYAITLYSEKDPPTTACEVVRWRLPDRLER